jgi:hypothetical protein
MNSGQAFVAGEEGVLGDGREGAPTPTVLSFAATLFVSQCSEQLTPQGEAKLAAFAHRCCVDNPLC